MALSQSVLSDLLDAFRAGEGVELIHDSVQLVLQELIELEASKQIGAARYERSDTRVTERNGGRPRLLTTQAGDIGLRIPKLRKGSFFPSTSNPRRRIDQACGRSPGPRGGGMRVAEPTADRKGVIGQRSARRHARRYENRLT